MPKLPIIQWQPAARGSSPARRLYMRRPAGWTPKTDWRTGSPQLGKGYSSILRLQGQTQAEIGASWKDGITIAVQQMSAVTLLRPRKDTGAARSPLRCPMSAQRAKLTVFSVRASDCHQARADNIYLPKLDRRPTCLSPGVAFQGAQANDPKWPEHGPMRDG
jgi:hypothetical protein